MGHPVTSLTYGLPEAASRLKIAPWHTRVRDWWACEANRPRQPGCHPHRHGQVSWKVCVYILWNNFSIHLNISMHVSILFSLIANSTAMKFLCLFYLSFFVLSFSYSPYLPTTPQWPGFTKTFRTIYICISLYFYLYLLSLSLYPFSQWCHPYCHGQES